MNSNLNYPNYVKDPTELDQAFNRIVKAIINGDAEILFGAGMSRESVVPTGKELLLALLNEFFLPQGINPPSQERLDLISNEFPFEAICEAIENMPGTKRNDLTNLLRKQILDTGNEPSQAHLDFLSVIHDGGGIRFKQIITTNFDYLIEETIGRERTIPITEENRRDLEKSQQNGLIPIIHLHGLLDKPGQDYIITESDIFRLEFSSIKTAFQTALYNADAFIFVGYSMTDPDFRRIYLEFRNQIKDRKTRDKDSYVVYPANDEFSYYLGRKIWELRGAIWIPLAAGAFFAKLKYYMSSRAYIEARNAIKIKYNIKDENFLDDLIKRTKDIFGITDSAAIRFLLQTQSRLGGTK